MLVLEHAAASCGFGFFYGVSNNKKAQAPTITPANNNGPIEKYGRSCERRNVDGARLQPALPPWMKFHACRSGS